MEEQSKTSTELFEQALQNRSNKFYCLRLYIAGSTIQSIRAVENIKKICEEYLPGHYSLEIIDVYQQPELAKPENIVALPTLVKTLPLPLQRVIGDLSSSEGLLIKLDIIPK